MARTPCFDLVRRSLSLAQSARHTGQSAAEAMERRREAALSRRAFLRASSAAAAGVTLGACAARRPAMRPASSDPVIVVGAGIAGLTAAWRLHQAGVPVRVIEAQNRVGGRMLSLRGYFAEGQVVEMGGELIDTGHARLRGLCQELGLALDDLADEAPDVARDSWYFGGQLRSEAEIIEAFKPVTARIEADVAALGEGDVTYRTPHAAWELDHTPLAGWLDRTGVVGWLRALLDVAYATEYGLETGDQSALNLLMMIDADPEPFRVFGESDERFHVRGGNDSVTSALATRLGPRIETGCALEALKLEADGRFSLSVLHGGAARVMNAAYVVLALPFTVLRDVRLDLAMPAVKTKAITELRYGTNAKLMAGFADRVWRTVHRTNGSLMADLAFQTTWETSRQQKGRAGVLTNFTGARHGIEVGRGSPAEQADALARELDRVWPGIAAARRGQKEARFHWPSHPWTRGSYASYGVGQWTEICGAEAEAVGRLHFAGEHCSLSAQGFMEGGCETGEAAAAAILKEMGISRAA
jgi:monoamine oxidase